MKNLVHRMEIPIAAVGAAILVFLVVPLSSATLGLGLLGGAVTTGLAAKSAAVAVVTGALFVVWLLRARGLSLRSLPAAFAQSPAWVQVLLVLPLVMLPAILFSRQDIAVSLVGTQERYDGLLLFSCGPWLCLLLHHLVRGSDAAVRWAVHLAVLGPLLPTVFVIAEAHPGASAMLVEMWPGNGHVSMEREFYGHPAITSAVSAVWLVLSVGYVVALPQRRWILALLVPAVFTLGLVLVGGRAAIVSAIVMVPTTSILLAVWKPTARRRIVAVLLVIMAAAVLALVSSDHARQRSTSLAGAAQGEDASFNHRVITWQAGLRALASSPLTGIGPGMFSHQIWENLSAAEEHELLLEFVDRDTRERSTRVGRQLIFPDPDSGDAVVATMNYDRAHNVFIDYALNYGGISLLVLLLALGLMLYELVRSRSVIGVSVGAAVVTYGIVLQAWFFNVQVDPIVWGLLGVGLAVVWRKRRVVPDDLD